MATEQRGATRDFVGVLHGRWMIRQELERSRDRAIYRVWNDETCCAGRLLCLDIRNCSADTQQRFVRRRDAMLSLTHPCVLRLLDHGDDPRPFIVEESTRWGTLEDNIRFFSRDLWRALRMARDIASGLEAAHQAGFIHRDVTPRNIGLPTLEHAVLGGFGVVHDPGSTPLTSIGERLGSRPYTAPESHEGKPSPAFDAFSLGAVLHSTLLGTAEPAPPYALRKVYQPLAGVHKNPQLAAVDELLQSMLNLGVAARPQSMGQVIAALDGVISRLFGVR
jgi:serine/threonine protein kinase